MLRHILLFLSYLCSTVSVLHAVPLAMKIVDMTYSYDESTQHFPGIKKFRLDVTQNDTTEGGFWLQIDEYSSATHAGTHLDAPAHFSKNGITVDQIPVNRLISPAAVVDVTAKAELNPDAEVTIEDLLEWESVTGKSLNQTILLLKTGWGRKWHDQTAFFGTPDNDKSKLHFPGLGVKAAKWLVDNRNVYGVGVETLSLDKGTAQDYPAHQIVQQRGIFILENVANMEKLPIDLATLYVMPMKIKKASGAPVRIVAVFPEDAFRDNLTEKEEL